MDNLFWGAVLRFLQALLQGTPTILIGLIVAGVFRRLIGYAGTRRLFGDNSWRSLPQAWALGMLLPVCSLGVIPVVRELRKAGVSTGAILAFGITAPLFNPISLLYGLTLSNPIVIFTFALCSLLIVTLVGLAWDNLFPAQPQAEREPLPVAYGIKRMLAVGAVAMRESASASIIYIVIGLIGVACLSVLLPNGYLQTSAEHDDPWAPLFMTVVAVPVYASPMTAMVQLSSMFQHGNSVGAAFSLLVLGTGLNVGLMAWMARNFGLKQTISMLGIIFFVVVGLAYALDKPLYPTGVEPAGHTHAFDIYCNPFHWNTQDAYVATQRTLREKTAPYEIASLVGLTALLIGGLLLNWLDPSGNFELWLERPSESKARLDIVLPGPVIGGVVLVGLVASSILGCYLYYPPPADIFEEMKLVNVEVVTAARTKDWDTALYWIPIYDDWTRKLQVSMYLRGESLSPYRVAKANNLREKLELLEHEVEDEEVEEAADLAMQTDRAMRLLRKAYLDSK